MAPHRRRRSRLRWNPESHPAVAVWHSSLRSEGSMPAPQTLMQAALARLGARLGSGLVDAAANLALAVQDAPERLRQELQLFWDEVEEEADRLERGDPSVRDSADEAPASIQDQIDALRAQVAGLQHHLDQRP